MKKCELCKVADVAPGCLGLCDLCHWALRQRRDSEVSE
jgi:hypothetical protein